MLIAIPIENGKLCSHFGRCEQFALVGVEPQTKQIKSIRNLTPPPHEPGVLPEWLHQQGVQVVIAGGMGRCAFNLLERKWLKIVGGLAPDPQMNWYGNTLEAPC